MAPFMRVITRGGVQREYAGGNALQNGFNVPGALGQLTLASASSRREASILPAADLQVFGHFVERAHQLADFAVGGDIDAEVQPAAGYFLSGLSQSDQRPGHHSRQEQGQP